MKVKFYNPKLWKNYAKIFSVLSSIMGVVLYFYSIPQEQKLLWGWGFLFLCIITFLLLWYKENNLSTISIKINKTTVEILTGDIFEMPDDHLITIGFNEYFDTKLDGELVIEESINGQFIKRIEKNIEISKLDEFIKNKIPDEDILNPPNHNRLGKCIKYKLGTVCKYNNYLLVAFAKVDDKNRATLTMSEYVNCLLNFWEQIDPIYGQKKIVIPILGTGITRFNRTNSKEELLKIILWTFKISGVTLNYPSKLLIVSRLEIMKEINLFNIKELENDL